MTFRSYTEAFDTGVREHPHDILYITGAERCNSSDVRMRALRWEDLALGCNNVHPLLLPHLSSAFSPDGNLLPAPHTIAILFPSSPVSATIQMVLWKLGHCALILSENNSAAGIAHLLEKTAARGIVYYSAHEAKVAEALTFGDGEREVQAVKLDIGMEIYEWKEGERGAVNLVESLVDPEKEAGRDAIFLHSSGSTGHPKPLAWSHYKCINIIKTLFGPECYVTLPIFHAGGFINYWRPVTLNIKGLIHPKDLPITPGNIVKVLGRVSIHPGVESTATTSRDEECRVVDTKKWQTLMIPLVLSDIATSQHTSVGREALKYLQDFVMVQYMGAPLPDAVGDMLIEKGVRLASFFGSTEVGMSFYKIRRTEEDKDWQWLMHVPVAKPYTIMEPWEGSETVFQPVYRGDFPNLSSHNRPDGSYASGDLFEKHPTKESYRFVGRADDTLVHVSGEKTNPTLLELMIKGSTDLVKLPIVFGAQRLQTGCLLLPSESASNLSEEDYLTAVWPAIEAANEQAPTHSRILPEMVRMLPPTTFVPSADKQTIKRAACYREFKDLIDRIYYEFEGGPADSAKFEMRGKDLLDYLVDLVTRTTDGPGGKKEFTVETNIFDYGVDSLQAARIRNVIQKELKLGSKILAHTVVYDHPTVREYVTKEQLDDSLSDYLESVVDGREDSNSEASIHLSMIDMVASYAKLLDPPANRRASATIPRTDEKRVVFLTGATGSLGAHLLYQYITQAHVTEVICLVRAASNGEGLERVKSSLSERELILGDEDWVKATVFQGDATERWLGLGEREYQKVQQRLSIVVHTAWPVNFVISLQSFSRHLLATTNLINFAAASHQKKPGFYFCSSISSQMRRSTDVYEEDFSTSPEDALPMGYARSKWVAERICEIAGTSFPGRLGVFRIGQLVGDTVNGIWTTKDTVPLMIRSAQVVGALPNLDDHPSYIPLDVAARCIVLVSTEQDLSTGAKVYHIVNPNAETSWSDILEYLRSTGVTFENVAPMEWVRRLNISNPDLKQNPTFKLASFFEQHFGQNGRNPAISKVSATNGSTARAELLACKAISLNDVQKWVQHWRKIGFLKS